MSARDATRSHDRKISAAVVLAVALWLVSVPISLGHAQDAGNKPAIATSTPAATCKAPAATAAAPGFSLLCGKRIPAGIFLGSFLSPAVDGLGDCIKRCAADAACAAFSLDNRDPPASRTCTLFGSAEGFADEPTWVAGVKVGRTPKIEAKAQGNQIDFDLPGADQTDFHFPGAKKSNRPIIVFHPTDTEPTWSDDSGYINNSVGSSAGGKHFHWGDVGSLTKTLSEWTGKTIFWAGSKEATAPKPADDIDAGGGQVVLTPDMLKLQPVYFATDRVRAAGAPLVASFTAGRNPDLLRLRPGQHSKTPSHRQRRPAEIPLPQMEL
jgi:hypothetical protein